MIHVLFEPLSTASWHSPIDFTYGFSGLDGWPMMLITVYETDIYDRQDLGGYGVFRLPTTPGVHIREIPISRPRGSWSESISAFFVGGRPKYHHPLVLTTGDSRYGHETISMGTIEIELTVILQGFDEAQLQHVTFDVDRSKKAIEEESVCQTCIPAKKKEQKVDEEEEEEEDTNRPKADEQPLLER